ncbi:MAG: hypothetical protein ACRDYE_14515, partial [Acidimicrobiales bacterium]
MDSDRFGAVDFDGFHRDQLPALLDTGHPLFSDSDLAAVQPLAFRLDDGRSYTYLPAGRSFAIEPGIDRAHTVVEMGYDPWREFRWELRSSFALLYA